MMLTGLLILNLLCLIVYMTIWFLIGKAKQRLDAVDTAWGGGFILTAVIAFIARHDVRTSLIGLAVLLWGLRLAVHIWQRSAFKGADPRYEELSAKWSKKYFWLRAYFSIFLLQGLIILVISLPVAVASSEPAKPRLWLMVVAGLLWLSGFLIESMADKQLSDFIKSAGHKAKVLQSGLWHYSRHPNYFGELVQWWAIAIMALGPSTGWLGLVGPVILSILIVFISGIPSIEKRRLKDPDYQAYKERTSVLIPLTPKT
jgi:steroid 5-alpha reductase family enzyme